MASDFRRTDFESIHYSAGVSLRVMGGREYYSYRNRTRRILLLSLKESFFLSTSKQLLKKCLKRLKRLELLLGTFRKSTGTEQWAHSTDRLFNEAVPLIPREIFPSMYVRNLQQEKGYRKTVRRSSDGMHRMALEGAGAIPCPYGRN